MIFGWFKSRNQADETIGEWEMGERLPLPEQLADGEPSITQLFEQVLSRLDDIERKIEAMKNEGK